MRPIGHNQQDLLDHTTILQGTTRSLTYSYQLSTIRQVRKSRDIHDVEYFNNSIGITIRLSWQKYEKPTFESKKDRPSKTRKTLYEHQSGYINITLQPFLHPALRITPSTLDYKFPDITILHQTKHGSIHPSVVVANADITVPIFHQENNKIGPYNFNNELHDDTTIYLHYDEQLQQAQNQFKNNFPLPPSKHQPVPD